MSDFCRKSPYCLLITIFPHQGREGFWFFNRFNFKCASDKNWCVRIIPVLLSGLPENKMYFGKSIPAFHYQLCCRKYLCGAESERIRRRKQWPSESLIQRTAGLEDFQYSVVWWHALWCQSMWICVGQRCQLKCYLLKLLLRHSNLFWTGCWFCKSQNSWVGFGIIVQVAELEELTLAVFISNQ